MLMSLIIIAVVGYWLLKMGGLDTIKGIIGVGGGGNSSSVNDSGSSSSNDNNNGNNVSNISNTGRNSHHGSIQQVSDINGVVSRKNSSFYIAPRYI